MADDYERAVRGAASLRCGVHRRGEGVSNDNHTEAFLKWRAVNFGEPLESVPSYPNVDIARGRVFDEWREDTYNGSPDPNREWNVEDWREYARLLFDDAYVLAVEVSVRK
jgi:hypothetical protein